jgi:hypothetical protein
MRGVSLYTSVPSRLIRQSKGEVYGDEYQKECINSWRDAGFNIISINPENEIDALVTKGYNIKFVSNGNLEGRTKFATFFSCIIDSKEPICGLINADCFLMNPCDVAIDRVLGAAGGSIVLLERLNIDPVTMKSMGKAASGFDAFFFDTRFVTNLDYADEWTIGEPFWDYWFPFFLHVSGASLKVAESTILVHLNHEVNWNMGDWRASGFKLFQQLQSPDTNRRLPAELAVQLRSMKIEDRSRHIDLLRFAHYMDAFWSSSAQRLTLCPIGSPGSFQCRMLEGMAESNGRDFEDQLRNITLRHWMQSKRRTFRPLKNKALKHLRWLVPFVRDNSKSGTET